MYNVNSKSTRAQILAAYVEMRDALDQERQDHAVTKDDFAREKTARIAQDAELKVLRAKVYDAPDKYCVTTPDGNCISEDPRCMHNTPAPKVLRAEVPRTGPDRYCVTEADGSCVSTDPRCMHNTFAPKSQEPSCEAPSAKPLTIKEFCAEYCRVHGTRSVPGDVVKAWRDSFKCRCGKCGGTGEYGDLGICYACQGTGEQTVQDIERNSTYWKLNG